MPNMKKTAASIAAVLAGGAAIVGIVRTAPRGAMSAAAPSTVVVSNDTGNDVVVYFSFGADSVARPANWPFCQPTSELTCNFPLHAHASQDLPLSGQYLNATASFGAAVGCGTTKAELNVNNPRWYDVVDISLVDGYSNPIEIDLTDSSGAHVFGPPHGAQGNEKVLGLYPLGCDICVARQHPPCGMSPGSDGCKTGSQFKPDVPCQYQATSMGGGSTIKVRLVGEPAK